MLEVGSKAENFKLNNQDGEAVSLSDFSGKWVVIYFYPKDSTPGCTKEACGFELMRIALEQNNAVILGISRDGQGSHKKFADNHSLRFSLLSDPDHEVIEAYGAWVEKSMFGKKYMGISRDTILVNPKGEIHKIYRKVKPDDIAKEILEDIKRGF